ncbi:hypothetical protein HYZ97_03725 [Candidatus Pacearchaeota archaeon]|nr:hypothetical protein [Candidatus Pacearchaeota archaeon]
MVKFSPFRRMPLTKAQKKMRRDIYREEHKDEINTSLRNYRRQNLEHMKVQHRRNYFSHRHGITPEQAELILIKQGGVCAICKSPITLGGKGGAKVDHCHSADIIRGVLCSTCNTGLGQFKDDIAILSNAIGYLESFRKKDESESEIGVAR